MKIKLLILSAITLAMAACGGSSTESTETTSTPVASEAPAKTGGELLIAKSDCVGCHTKENKIVGPAYLDIAAKYPSNEENINLLASKIIKGGKGVWGNVPMTPHTKITEDEAKQMATYILSLKK